MADSWIKMRVTLGTCPQVVRIASALHADGMRGEQARMLAVGALHATWALADTHTEDGVLAGYTPEVLDELIGLSGWTEALVSVGWAVVTPEGISIPGFAEHNGASAKRRAKEAKRKRDGRKPGASDADAASASRPQRERPPSSSPSLSSSEVSGEGVQGEGARECPGPDGERVPQPAGIGPRLADVLEGELEPISARAMALIVRLDTQTREARADDDNAKAAELGSSAWRNAIARARSDPDAFEAQVALTEQRSAKNLQTPDTEKSPAGGSTERVTPRVQVQRNNRAAMAEAIRREEAEQAEAARLRIVEGGAA